MAKKILMVDDEPDVLKIVKLRLVKQGYEVIFAENGQQAFEAARSQKPDIILMDYRMPVLNGLEASKLLKADQELKHIPIIFMTASSVSVTLDNLSAVGVSDCIRKPFEADDLLKKIKNYIG